MATTITQQDTTTTTTRLEEYSSHFKVKQQEILLPTDLILSESTSYESVNNSTNTTTSNSPVISSPHESLELSCCPCNQVITSNYDCADCHSKFDTIKELSDQHKETKILLKQTQQQIDLLRHESQEYETKHSQLEQALKEKQVTIETRIQGIKSLHHDLKVLKIKCQEESDQVQDIQESKEAVKRELEELGIKLFEEANAMIKIEKEQQEAIQIMNSQLELDLKSTVDSLEEAYEELKLIREKINQHNDKKESHYIINHSNIIDEQPSTPPPTTTTTTLFNTHNHNVMIDTYTRAQVETILMHGLDLGIYMDTLEDDACLMDFNDFIQQLYKTPLRKLHSLKYMKYCYKDDIEPTLRFGPNPKISAKKIMDAILVKTCFIEESPYGFITEQDTLRRLKKQEDNATSSTTTSLWERFTSSSNNSTTTNKEDASIYLGCQACGRNTMEKQSRPELLKYRFRISWFDEWACIDRYCRDRLLSVVEFYMFIRHLRAGSYKCRSLHELYQQFMRLKLQMFIARMGALPNMLQNCGINEEKIATAFHGEMNQSVILLNNESTMTMVTTTTTTVDKNERLSSSTESTITSISSTYSPRTSSASASFSTT